MKPRLSHLLLSALLICGTYQAQAVRNSGNLAVATHAMTDGSTLVVSTSGTDMNPGSYKPYTIEATGNVSISAGGTMNNALFVRESTVTAGNGTDGEHITVTLNPTLPGTVDYVFKGAGTSFSVAGKGATMKLDNATLKSTVASSMVVGSPDGNGTLIISNNSTLDNFTGKGINFLIGAGTSNKHYDAHIHATYSENPKTIMGFEVGGTKYSSGDHATLKDGSEIGAGYVTVEGESTLMSGSNGVVIGQGSLEIKGNSSAYFGYDNGALNDEGLPETPCGQADNFESCIGAIAGSTSSVSVTDGSTFSTGVGLKIGAFDDTKVTIEVGKDSLFEVADRTTGAAKTYIGTAFEVKKGSVKDSLSGSQLEALAGVADALIPDSYDRTWNETGSAATTVEMTISDGGTAKFNDLQIGSSLDDKADVTISIIGENSHLTADNMNVYGGATITNEGTLTAAELVLNGGTLENSGTLEADVVLGGGVFTMCDGATAQGLTATAGVVNISGEVTFTGVVNFGTSPYALMTLASTESTEAPLTINIEQGSTINMDDVAMNIGEGVIFNVNLVGDGQLAAGESLFTINYGSLDSAEVEAQLNQVTTTLSYNGNVVETYEPGNLQVGADGTTTVVPEPATATLSLLALAALAARRRRK